jgi:acyl-CoA synthetase (AMP-forming)/AMP-acid ligase II
MFFPSPRNTIEAYQSLFDSAGATKIISLPQPLPIVKTILQKRPMQLLAVPSLESLLDNAPVPPMPLQGTFEDNRFKPLIQLHTSGSTGMPKIITLKHGLFATFDGWGHIPGTLSVPQYENKRIFSPFPPFHIAGVNYTLCVPCFFDGTAVLPPPGVPVSADLVHSIHMRGSVNSSVIPPSIVQELTQNEEQYEGIGQLDVLTFSGGPLLEQAADLVNRKAILASSMGATEYGGVPVNAKDPEDWGFFRFDLDANGVDMRDTGQEGLYELVFVRKPHLDHLQGAFVTFPELEEYHTKDCFSKHPSKPGLWKYESRLDDIIVLSNGEKLNPVPMEKILLGCSALKGAIIYGQGRFQTSLLVEPKSHDMSFDELRALIEPLMVKANRVCPAYGRLSMNLLVVTSPEKPLPRAAKGTVQRAHTYNLYKDELAALYYKQEHSKEEGPMTSKLDLQSAPEKSLMNYVCDMLDVDSNSFKATDDAESRAIVVPDHAVARNSSGALPGSFVCAKCCHDSTVLQVQKGYCAWSGNRRRLFRWCHLSFDLPLPPPEHRLRLGESRHRLCRPRNYGCRYPLDPPAWTSFYPSAPRPQSKFRCAVCCVHCCRLSALCGCSSSIHPHHDLRFHNALEVP